MSDHTPSTATTRECFLDGAAGEFTGADFDRWLAEMLAEAVQDFMVALSGHADAATYLWLNDLARRLTAEGGDGP